MYHEDFRVDDVLCLIQKAYPDVHEVLNSLRAYIHELENRVVELCDYGRERFDTQATENQERDTAIVKELLAELARNGAIKEVTSDSNFWSPYNKIAMIKSVRSVLHSGLKDTKDMVEQTLDPILKPYPAGGDQNEGV